MTSSVLPTLKLLGLHLFGSTCAASLDRLERRYFISPFRDSAIVGLRFDTGEIARCEVSEDMTTLGALWAFSET
jgi:hypothetical protein